MRKVTSLTLFIAGLIEIVTSVVLYIIPSGRVAYWAEYRLWGLSKIEWGNIHITVGTLFLLMAAVHLFYNWRLIIGYTRNKVRKISVFTKSFVIALFLSCYVTIGTLYSLPPMNLIIELGEYFTAEANEKYGEPPYGHAELSSLKMFCRRMDIKLAIALELLRKEGVKVNNGGQSLSEIAKNNSLKPKQIYDIIRTAQIEQPAGSILFPEIPSPGFGKKTIREICSLYDLPESEIVFMLKKAGFTALPEDTLKQVANNNASNPMTVFELLQEAATSLGK